MNWEPIRIRLSHILNTEVIQKSIPRSFWKTPSSQFEIEGEVIFVLESSERRLVVFSVPEIFITESEKSLVELLIEQYKQLYQSDPTTEKPSWLRIRSWILRQLDEQNTSVLLPETLFPSERLNEQWLPLLLQTGKIEDNIDHDYKELKDLLDSFFDVETILIPLHQHEWLIFVSVKLLFESEDDVVEDATSELRLEEVLESFGYGLNEMFTNEWIADCLLAVGRPMNPRTEIIQTIEILQQCVQLGRKYRPEEQLCFPWRMQLEWLLDQISTHHVTSFLEQTLNVFNKQLLDGELTHTLEQFFEENCNVSETAKKLYIHRNTLIYRLDKLKQETGMDVRNFRHAVLVQIAILLYKVTKH